MDNAELSARLDQIANATKSLVGIVTDLREATTSRLDEVEQELQVSTRQLQQAIILLTELAVKDDDPSR